MPDQEMTWSLFNGSCSGSLAHSVIQPAQILSEGVYTELLENFYVININFCRSARLKHQTSKLSMHGFSIRHLLFANVYSKILGVVDLYYYGRSHSLAGWSV